MITEVSADRIERLFSFLPMCCEVLTDGVDAPGEAPTVFACLVSGDIRHICPRRFFGMPMQTNYIDLKSLAAARIWSVVQVVTITPGEGLHQ